VKHVIPISGKDSLTTYILQKQLNPNLKYETIFNDTGLELPETYTWLSNIEAKLEITIKRIGSNLLEIIYEQGILPAPKTRYCTRLSKIYPMEDYFGKEKTTVYFGIRADEKRIGYKPSKRADITPAYPLIDLGVTLSDVYSILSDYDLLPPTFFWHEVHDRVCTIVGNSAIEKLSQVEFDMLFSWRSRPNCYNCFYQRQYEYIGLSIYHPELFEDACQLEREVGGDSFSIRAGYWLSDLLDKKDIIIKRRITEIVNFIGKKTQTSFLTMDNDLSFTSCGLFCGK